jgi:DNA-binding response OmpR family regulator
MEVNILLAEDDKNLGSIIKNELEEEAYNIDLVYDGVEAVLRFIDKSYNFILLDITMPKLDGINTLRIIKRLDPDVPVIAFSGNAALHQIEATCREGAIKCLTKPFLITELKDSISRYKSK